MDGGPESPAGHSQGAEIGAHLYLLKSIEGIVCGISISSLGQLYNCSCYSTLNQSKSA